MRVCLINELWYSYTHTHTHTTSILSWTINNFWHCNSVKMCICLFNRYWRHHVDWMCWEHHYSYTLRIFLSLSLPFYLFPLFSFYFFLSFILYSATFENLFNFPWILFNKRIKYVFKWEDDLIFPLIIIHCVQQSTNPSRIYRRPTKNIFEVKVPSKYEFLFLSFFFIHTHENWLKIVFNEFETILKMSHYKLKISGKSFCLGVFFL